MSSPNNQPLSCSLRQLSISPTAPPGDVGTPGSLLSLSSSSSSNTDSSGSSLGSLSLNSNSSGSDNDSKVSSPSREIPSDPPLPRAVPTVRLGRSTSSRSRNSLNLDMKDPSEKPRRSLPTAAGQNNIGSPPTPPGPFPGGLSTDIQEKLKAFHASRSKSMPEVVNKISSPTTPIVGMGQRGSYPLPNSQLAGRLSNSPVKSPNMPESGLAKSLAAARNPLLNRPTSFNRQTRIRRAPPGKLDLSNSNPTSPVSPSSMASRRGLNIPPTLKQAVSETPFSTFSDILDAKSGTLNFKNKAVLNSEGVNFSSGSSFRINMSEIIKLEELGKGNYGVVYKALHQPTGVTMALKEIRLSLEEADRKSVV